MPCYESKLPDVIRALKASIPDDVLVPRDYLTFVDAVSAMEFPDGWKGVAEEASRVRAMLAVALKKP